MMFSYRPIKKNVRPALGRLLGAAVLAAAMGLSGMTPAASAASPAEFTLSLQDAVSYAEKNSYMVRLAEERVKEFHGIHEQSASHMFPHLSVESSNKRIFKENLSALGFSGGGVIGPYNTFDARVQLEERVFDLGAVARLQASGTDVRIAGFGRDLARQQIEVSAATAYLQALQADAELKSLREDIRLARRLLALAEDQKKAGLATAVDVARARTHLAQEEAKRADILDKQARAYFNIKRITGLPLDAKVALTDTLSFFEEPPVQVNQSVETAFKDRIEMKIASAQVVAKDYEYKAASRQRIPQVDIAADYGYSGLTPRRERADTGEAAVLFHMPLFEGGQIEGEMRQQASQKRQAELARDDMSRAVEEDVRLASQSLKSAIDQVRAATQLLSLAHEEMRLSRNRFTAGVGDNIEVVNAQATLENAQETYVTALVRYHTARINYYSSIGNVKAFHLSPATGKRQGVTP